jgi:hypothetical protein
VLQPQAIPKRDIKGTLPAPRNLFPNRGPDKTTAEYLAYSTPEPTAHHQLSEPQNERIAWKRRMAATRRQHLREGLVELHNRKVRTDKAVAFRSAIKRSDRAERVNAPQCEDERLTNSTITAAMRLLTKGNVPDPNREDRLAVARARVEEKAKSLEDERRDALHTLYMHARDFITTEAHLDAEIEKVFTERPFKNNMTDVPTDNVWEAYGAPPTVRDMLSEVNNTQGSAVQYHSGPAVPYGKRMLKIAEELTGGKMDDKM